MNEAPKNRKRRWMSSVLLRLAVYPFLGASLLVFPAALPWMILGWLVIWGFQVLRRKPSWPPLASCLGVILVKRVDWAPGLVILGFLMAVVACTDVIPRRAPGGLGRAFHGVAAGFLALSWLAMAWSWNRGIHSDRHPRLLPDRPIGILGDSLSSGGYPEVLAKQLRIPVVNRSQGGITAQQGLGILPELLQSRPQAVVIELGGHDYLQGRSRQETRAVLERAIRQSRGIGAEVILFEVPRGFISDPFSGIERELAREYDLELITDGVIRDLVIFSPFMPMSSWIGPHLSYDGLHPNAAGNSLLADRVEQALHRVFGGGIAK